MSLLLNGAKTMTIAGTEMQCLEIYTGEAYTFPLQFTDNTGNALNCNGWSLGVTAKFYEADNVTYVNADNVVVGNITLSDPQPTANAYSANLTAAFTNANTGLGYMYVPSSLTGGTGSPNPTPVISLANSAANSTLVILTLQVSRVDPLSTKTNINKEPIGVIVRYQ